jgi:hypothetical protein
MKNVLQYVITAIGLFAAILALQPDEWSKKLQSWFHLVYLPKKELWSLVFVCVVLFVFLIILYHSKQKLTVWSTRKSWWDKNLSRIIFRAEKLILVDSYQGSKHEFWDLIERRICQDAPFHLIMLDLSKDNPMLKHCIETSRASEYVLDLDEQAIKRLVKKRNQLENGGNKTIEFGYWDKESQGPLVAWIINGKETIAAGLWQQVAGNTDLSPWLISCKGPVFKSLKSHYETLIRDARKNGMIDLT